MGTHYNNAFRVRDAITSTLDVVIAAYDAVHAAIIGCGMVQLSSTEAPGQAGKFVVGPAGAGETALDTSPISTTTAVAGARTDGSRVYKHPTLQLYMRMEYRQMLYTTAAGVVNSRCAGFRTTFAAAMSAGDLAPGGNTGGITSFDPPTGAYAVNTTSVSTAAFALSASCGADHFWMYVAGSLPLTVNGVTVPDGGTVLGIGAFASAENPRAMVVLAPMITSTSSAVITAPAYNLPGVKGLRVWTLYEGVVEAADACSIGYLFDPKTAITSSGTRIMRAHKYMNGFVHRFDIAVLPRLALIENAVYPLNLDGAGVRPYRSCLGLGPASPALYGMTTEGYCSLALPWNE